MEFKLEFTILCHGLAKYKKVAQKEQKENNGLFTIVFKDYLEPNTVIHLTMLQVDARKAWPLILLDLWLITCKMPCI